MAESAKYLPLTGDDKCYSPRGVVNKFEEAVKEEDGSIEAIFKKDKHKKLVELWRASPLAVMINKLTKDEYYLFPAENPDVHFIANINTSEQKGFSVEVMELFDFQKKGKFDGDYVKIAKKVWNKKGVCDYDRSWLLLASRLEGAINIDLLIDEINKYSWKFLQIWLSAYSSADSTWHLFQIVPPAGERPIKFDVGLTDIPY